MNILDKIIETKRIEIAQKKETQNIFEFEKMPLFERKCISLSKRLKEAPYGIIAEFKRKSPSKGNLSVKANPKVVAKGYSEAKVGGISVLTDSDFFGAKPNDFSVVRQTVEIPLLRKDFVIDEFQIFESKAMGADVVLLIASVLSPPLIERLTYLTHDLGMEVLLETHHQKEILDNLETTADMIGINNRNLSTFEVDIEQSIRLCEKLPREKIKIAESGLDHIATIQKLKTAGFDGFLIGEYFMKNNNPGNACQELIKELNR